MDTLPLRQLAIRLACIHADDRAWILAQLDPPERQQMDALLIEISDLGMDKDTAVLAAMSMKEITRLAMPDAIAPSSRLRHPYWQALSEQTTPPALVAALARHVAMEEVSDVGS